MINKNIISIILIILALLFAFFSQHFLHWEPCPWCIFQRIIYIFLLFNFIIITFFNKKALYYLSYFFILGGIFSSLWQIFFAQKTNSCNLTLADQIINFSKLDLLFPDFFEVRASCFEAVKYIFGFSFSFWSFILFLLIFFITLKSHNKN